MGIENGKTVMEAILDEFSGFHGKKGGMKP